jgi:hypothetical protein
MGGVKFLWGKVRVGFLKNGHFGGRKVFLGVSFFAVT